MPLICHVGIEGSRGRCKSCAPPLPSTSALMTLPRAESDRLIRVASRRRSPVEPAFDCQHNSQITAKYQVCQ